MPREVSRKSGQPNRLTKAWLRTKRVFIPTQRRVNLLRKVFVENKQAAFLVVMPEMIPFLGSVRNYLQNKGFKILFEKQNPRLSRTDIEEVYGRQARKYSPFLRAPLIRNWPTVVVFFRTNGRECFNAGFKSTLREELVKPLLGGARIPEHFPTDLKNFLSTLSESERRTLFSYGIHMPETEAEILKDSNVFLKLRDLKRIINSA